MFGVVGRGALIGTLAGALLGGAVSFVLTRNPIPGVVAGAIVGGVAGGIVAYYNFVTKRAQGNIPRALRDLGQDAMADGRKSLRLAYASSRGTNELQSILSAARPKTDGIVTLNDAASARQACVVSLSQCQDVYGGVTQKLLGVSADPFSSQSFRSFSSDLKDGLFQIRDSIESIARNVQEIRDIALKLGVSGLSTVN
jgi:hypothetical protein